MRSSLLVSFSSFQTIDGARTGRSFEANQCSWNIYAQILKYNQFHFADLYSPKINSPS